ncbi:MAG: DUF5654 family protein [Candidatus Spechtbacterales bacterium]|nr:DUF5654 family protein [Candidatus Spechtbacterales bacterium]
MAKLNKKRKDEIRREIKKRTAGYIVAGLALVGGLAWNDAIKTLIETFFPKSGTTVIAKLAYAIFITIVIVIAGYYVTKFFEKEEIKKEEEKEEKKGEGK